MKQPIITTLLMLGVLLCASCQQDEEATGTTGKPFVYSMHLDGDISHYGQTSTRTTEPWADRSTIILQFFDGTQRITGTATYSAAQELWTVVTDNALTADNRCEAYYFENPERTSGRIASFGATTVGYADSDGSYTVDTDTKTVIVSAHLTPVTARLRFSGTPNTTFSVSGLKQLLMYNGTSNTFTASESKLTGKTGADGLSDYYYVLCANAVERRLTVDAIGAAVYIRSLAADVLQPGSSGRITLPTAEQMGQWQMVNANNGEEITLPVVTGASATAIRSHRVTLTATVGNNGNGTLLTAGFLVATTADMADAVRLECTPQTQLSLGVKGLQSATQYYLQAFVQNERGTAYSNVQPFTTLDEEVGIDDFPEDADWGDAEGTEATIGVSEFPDDSNWD